MENSDSGWVTSSGVGAYQLRVGQPPGSKEPLVSFALTACDHCHFQSVWVRC